MVFCALCPLPLGAIGLEQQKNKTKKSEELQHESKKEKSRQTIQVIACQQKQQQKAT